MSSGRGSEEKIRYRHEGRQSCRGTKDDMLQADHPELNDIVRAWGMAKEAELAAKYAAGFLRRFNFLFV